MPGIKRAPDSFPSEGPGGAMHRYDALSKADWADAYADLYQQVHGFSTTIEMILADAEHRDDLRRYAAGQKPAKHPKPASERDKAYYRAWVALRVAASAEYQAHGYSDEYLRLVAEEKTAAADYKAGR